MGNKKVSVAKHTGKTKCSIRVFLVGKKKATEVDFLKGFWKGEFSKLRWFFYYYGVNLWVFVEKEKLLRLIVEFFGKGLDKKKTVGFIRMVLKILNLVYYFCRLSVFLLFKNGLLGVFNLMGVLQFMVFLNIFFYKTLF